MKYDVSLQTIAWINGRRNDATLEISPKFQRRAVWLESERSELIGTILGGLPFPEVYVQQVTDLAIGSEKHIVVDGQQRITSILMFIDNDISLPTSDDWQGQYFRDLTDDQRGKLWNYKVVVRGLSETNDAEIRDLFTRLNTNNVALNDQELRNARYKGRFKATAERIADNPLFLNIGLFTARDIRRMLDVEFASELLVLTIEGVINKKDLIDEAYARFEEDFPREAEFEADVNTALSLVRSIVIDGNTTAIKTKSNFYSLFGACLRYCRGTGRQAFHNADAVALAVGDLLNTVRAGGEQLQNKPDYFPRYFDAVTRAASDRGRRAAREDILSQVINEADVVAGPN
jgi:hypothetical protein